MKLNKSHLRCPVHDWIKVRKDYSYPSDYVEWKRCPRCKLVPKIGIKEDSPRTACGCWRSLGDRWEIGIDARKGPCEGYNFTALKDNWNTYCATGKLKFKLGKGFSFSWIKK